MHVNRRTLDRQGNNDIQMADILLVCQMVQIIFSWKERKKWQLFDQMFITKMFKVEKRYF
jgi:hypothetical protein